MVIPRLLIVAVSRVEVYFSDAEKKKPPAERRGSQRIVKRPIDIQPEEKLDMARFLAADRSAVATLPHSQGWNGVAGEEEQTKVQTGVCDLPQGAQSQRWTLRDLRATRRSLVDVLRRQPSAHLRVGAEQSRAGRGRGRDLADAVRLHA